MVLVTDKFLKKFGVLPSINGRIASLYYDKQDNLNRTVGSNDNATGTITDTGGNLSVPVQVTLAAPTASNNINTQAAETVNLRTAIQRAYNNITHLFANKANAASITAATKAKITYNAQGIITAGADLAAADIPNLSATKITSDTLGTDRIPNLAASKITSGTLGTDRIPSLSADKITSGTLPQSRGGTGKTNIHDASRAFSIVTTSFNIDTQRSAGLYYIQVGPVTMSGTTPSGYGGGYCFLKNWTVPGTALIHQEFTEWIGAGFSIRVWRRLGGGDTFTWGSWKEL
jgi:hypothetical protein